MSAQPGILLLFPETGPEDAMSVEFDLDGLLERTRGKRLAVACPPAGWLPGRGLVADFLADRADVRGFLALEHGLRGELQDGVRFDSCTDARTGLPVFSFYGGTHTFPPEFLSEVDLVVFHAQDVSHRAYTYKQALADTLTVAARTDTAVLVLDRPSPLAHLGSRGPLLAQFFPAPLPVVLAVTLGELARWLRLRQELDVDLAVVPVRGWRRSMGWRETGLPWVPPSPNIPSLDSAYCYACTGILQQTNVSEGRGTCKPFEYFGAPFVDARRLVSALSTRALRGLLFREVYFQPAFGKYAGQTCAGAHLIIEAPAAVQPLRAMFAVLQELARLHPGRFELLPGFAAWLDNGTWDGQRLAALDIDAEIAAARPGVETFMDEMAPFLLYGD